LKLEERLLRAHRGDYDEIGRLHAEVTSHDSAVKALMLEAAIAGTLQAIDPSGAAATPPRADDLPMVDSARQAVERWLELRPAPVDQAAGFMWSGRLRYLVGEHVQGLLDLQKAVEFDPDSYAARFHFALLAAQRHPVESLKHLAILLEREPENTAVKFALAGGYREIGQLDDAAKLFDELLDAEPKNPLFLYARGGVAIDRSRPREAEPFLRRAVEGAPDHPEAHLALSRCLEQLGETDDARFYLKRYEQLAARRGPPP
jgi:tetratricopeptide (TPR) repeat protein